MVIARCSLHRCKGLINEKSFLQTPVSAIPGFPFTRCIFNVEYLWLTATKIIHHLYIVRFIKSSLYNNRTFTFGAGWFLELLILPSAVKSKRADFGVAVGGIALLGQGLWLPPSENLSGKLGPAMEPCGRFLQKSRNSEDWHSDWNLIQIFNKREKDGLWQSYTNPITDFRKLKFVSCLGISHDGSSTVQGKNLKVPDASLKRMQACWIWRNGCSTSGIHMARNTLLVQPKKTLLSVYCASSETRCYMPLLICWQIVIDSSLRHLFLSNDQMVSHM